MSGLVKAWELQELESLSEPAQFKLCWALTLAPGWQWLQEPAEGKPCGACRQWARGGKGQFVSAPWGNMSSFWKVRVLRKDMVP